MVMNHQPFVTDQFEEVCGEDLGLLWLIGLLSHEVFDADDPAHVAGHLHHHIGQLEFHRERVVKDEHPRVSYGRPPGTNRPARVNAGDIVLMHPDVVHPGNVEALKCFVECPIGLRNGFDALLQQLVPLAQRRCIILQLNCARRGHFSPASMEGEAPGATRVTGATF